ncbi:MAG: MFS transporter [SAR202 cluster bacterium]|nr:MFS transporter [SAR202 cluster bacterium]MQG56291.1 MFS transporter [SAR202 cluster bacterium]MQG68965.1 MFS transporter [SAR202 cluster bacterium]HAL46172.1 MFS transporter [Dehalococcoidia bacterium]
MQSLNRPTTTSAGVIQRARGVFYGWRVVGVGAFLLTLMAVSVFQGLGLFLVSLERHFGWSRTAMSGAFTLARGEGAVLGPLEGLLIDRFGSRKLVLAGYCIIGFGFILLSMIQSLWHFYAAFIIITLGSGLGGWLAVVSTVNNWFIRRRSLAIAATTSGIHFGGFLVPVLALGMDTHGFRWATLGIGVFMLLMIGPAVKVIRTRPEDIGLLPDGDSALTRASDSEDASTKEGIAQSEEAEFTVRQALRTSAFWILTIVHISSTISIVTLSLHLVPKLTDMGLSLSTAGIVVLTYTATAVPTQFLAGFIADRLPKPPVLFAFLALQAAGMMVIAFADSIEVAFLFAFLYGMGFGGRVPLLTSIRGDYFGRKAFATIMGLSQMPNNIAMMFAPLFAAYMYDTTDSYLIPFLTFAILNFLGAVLVLFVRKPRLAG